MLNPDYDPKNRIVLALDLELNQAAEGSKIIELGYVIGNLDTKEILVKKSLYINPHEQLVPFIIKLTGITQEMVDAGTTLQLAYEEMKRDCATHKAQTAGRIIVWGQGDIGCLRETLGSEDFDGAFFGRRYFDTKTLFQFWQLAQGRSIQSGLRKALIKLGIHFQGRAHSGADDAFNTLRAFIVLMEKIKA